MKPRKFTPKQSAWINGSADFPIPTSALPPPLRAMVRSIADVYHLPEVMPTAIALAMVSAALGKGLQIASAQGRTTMGNLYFLISAGSGTGKSTILRILREPLDMIQVFLREYPDNPEFTYPNPNRPTEDEGGIDGIEGIVGLLPPPGSEAGPKSQCRGTSGAEESVPRLICSEVTAQALIKLLAENNETILNATAEAGNLLDDASRMTSPLGQLLLKGYSGDQVEIDRVSRKSVLLVEPCISVCWLCQPHRIEKFFSSERLMDDGLLARFHVAHSEAGMAALRKEDSAIPIAVSDSYGATINSLYMTYGRRSEDRVIVNATPEAREILRIYQNHCAERWRTHEGSLHSCISRWTEQAWKMTLVLHAAIHGANAHLTEVDQQTAEQAVELQGWFADQQMRIIRGTTMQPEIDRLEKLCKLLLKAPKHEITLRNLHNSHGFPGDEVHRLVEMAPSRLYLKTRKNPRGGPTSLVLSLIQNPL